MADKGQNFFEVWVSHKILDTLKKKTVKSTEVPDFFPITMPSESLLTSIKPASMGKSVCGRNFSPAAEFFRKSGRKHLAGVGNTGEAVFLPVLPCKPGSSSHILIFNVAAGVDKIICPYPPHFLFQIMLAASVMHM
jgi:hypothetical protein